MSTRLVIAAVLCTSLAACSKPADQTADQAVDAERELSLPAEDVAGAPVASAIELPPVPKSAPERRKAPRTIPAVSTQTVTEGVVAPEATPALVPEPTMAASVTPITAGGVRPVEIPDQKGADQPTATPEPGRGKGGPAAGETDTDSGRGPVIIRGGVTERDPCKLHGPTVQVPEPLINERVPRTGAPQPGAVGAQPAVVDGQPRGGASQPRGGVSQPRGGVSLPLGGGRTRGGIR